MRLLYIWINDYKCFNNAELNFSDGIRFNYNKQTHLLCREETESKNDLFSLLPCYSNVDNISIIVGSNGSGKTSICELLFEIFYLGNSNIDHILIYEQDGERYIHKNENTICINQSGIELTNYFHINNFNFIYYSPFYSSMHVMQTLGSPDNSTFHDISTSALLKNDKIYYENHRSNVSYVNSISNLDANTISDFKRTIVFLIEALKTHHNFKLGVSFPQTFFFKVDNNDRKAFENEFQNENDIFTIYQDIVTKIENTHENKVICNLLLALFCNFGRSTLNRSHSGLNHEVAFEYISRIQNAYPQDEQSVYSIFRTLFQSLNSSENISGLLVQLPNTRTQAMINFFNFLINLDSTFFVKDGISFNIPDNKTELIEFHKLYKLTQQLTEYGTFEPQPYLSSGEYSEILLYSRLYEICNTIIERDENKNIILFLDEVEITLHPKLQQGIIQNLLYFTEEFFPESSLHLQIIFATHSPIILSDVPSPNVIFLYKEPGQFKSKIESSKTLKTFGSNIYTLYQDSFFITDIPIGNFVREQINKAIEDVNSKYNSQESVSDLTKYVISQIGEPILKNMIESRMKNNDSISTE